MTSKQNQPGGQRMDDTQTPARHHGSHDVATRTPPAQHGTHDAETKPGRRPGC